MSAIPVCTGHRATYWPRGRGRRGGRRRGHRPLRHAGHPGQGRHLDQESHRRSAKGRRHPHRLRVDRRRRPHSAALLQDQAARRTNAGGDRRRPHGAARHAIPRSDQGNLHDPAVLARTVHASWRGLPADSYPRRGGPARRVGGSRAGVSRGRHRRARRAHAMPIWHGCISPRTRAVAALFRCRCQDGSSPAIGPGHTWHPTTLWGPSGSRTTSPKQDKFAWLSASLWLVRAQFG